MNDTMSEEGARRLMERIRQYWREQGYELPIMHMEQITDGKGRGLMFAVRSDMVNGKPERRVIEKAKAA